MFTVEGKYSQAVIFTDNVEQEAISQIINLCNQPFVDGSKIRIMPDAHAGAGCTIGTTMTIRDKIVPNLVGVDIGCGMEVVRLVEKAIDLPRLDATINRQIPCGTRMRDEEHPLMKRMDLSQLASRNHVNLERASLSMGTLGGGNHFIELNVGKDGSLYLVVHSGSATLGKQVAEYYQDNACEKLVRKTADRTKRIEKLRAEGRQKEIDAELTHIDSAKVDRSLAYLTEKDFSDYLHDMQIVQQYALYNRIAISTSIINAMGLTVAERFATIHNYIDVQEKILRKGAISAKTGEKVIIPINMRDGSILALGKGNDDWNMSAPHGAGRLFSRSAAKEKVSLEEFEESMTGIYSSSVCESTIDESPMAYKPIEEILENIADTVDVLEVIRPLYNFKAH